MDKEDLKKSQDYLLNVCKGLEELRLGNKSDIRQAQLETFVAGNKIISNLNKYLFTVATLLIPIIFSLVSLNEIRQRLSQGDGVLIAMSIIFLFLSLVAGFIHMVSEFMFLKKSLKNIERKLKLWSSVSFWPSVPLPDKIKSYIEEYELIKARTEDISSEMGKDSTNIFIIAQGTYLLTGVVPIVVIVFRQLP